VGDGILSVVGGPPRPPRADLDARLAALATSAAAGDRPRLLTLLSEIAPGYEPPAARLADAGPAPAGRTPS
jgi:hypothetical protein